MADSMTPPPPMAREEMLTRLRSLDWQLDSPTREALYAAIALLAAPRGQTCGPCETCKRDRGLEGEERRCALPTYSVNFVPLLNPDGSPYGCTAHTPISRDSQSQGEK